MFYVQDMCENWKICCAALYNLIKVICNYQSFYRPFDALLVIVDLDRLQPLVASRSRIFTLVIESTFLMSTGIECIWNRSFKVSFPVSVYSPLGSFRFPNEDFVVSTPSWCKTLLLSKNQFQKIVSSWGQYF